MKFYIRFFAFLLFSTILFAEDKEIFLPFPKDSTESYAQEKSQNNTEENSSAENKISKGDSSSSGEIKNSSGLKRLSGEGTEESELPNLKDIKRKAKGKKKNNDESLPPFERAKYYINRSRLKTGGTELDESISKQGVFADKAKLDKIRLLALDRKKSEAESLITGLDASREDLKFQAYFELGNGLENSGSFKEEKDEAIPYYLKIITEAPEGSELIPRTLWTIASLHYKMAEYRQSLDYLSRIILHHPNTEYIDDAVYLSALIYERGDQTVKDHEKARKYYNIFLNSQSNPYFKKSIYLKEVKQRKGKF